MSETLEKGEGGKGQGDVIPSYSFRLDFLGKKKARWGKHKVNGVKRMERKAGSCPFYCKERCRRNLLERGRGKGQGRSCLLVFLLFDFLEKKKRERDQGTGVMLCCAFLLDCLEKKKKRGE